MPEITRLTKPVICTECGNETKTPVRYRTLVKLTPMTFHIEVIDYCINCWIEKKGR